MSAADPRPVVGLVCSAAGGVERVRTGYVEPALARGWRLAITLTPTASAWLRANGELEKLQSVTDLPVRSESRLPWEPRPHPPADCWVVAPATANTVAGLALGLAPNQALTQLCEALGAATAPIIVVPRVNAAHAAHPAWAGHLTTLRTAGVHLVDDGPRSWPPDQDPPWPAILTATGTALHTGR